MDETTREIETGHVVKFQAGEVKARLLSILGDGHATDSLVERVIERLSSDDPTGEIVYGGGKLGNCYHGYSSLVFGDGVMPGGNGGPARAKTDVTNDLLGRVRTCYYTVDSSG